MRELTIAEATEALKQGKRIKAKGRGTPLSLNKKGEFTHADGKNCGFIVGPYICDCISDFEDILNGKYFVLAEEILDKQEREYLGNIVRPFKGKYKGIKIEKRLLYKEEYIVIYLEKRDEEIDMIDLPLFDKGNMYVGMEPNKQYTLEELGL